MVEKTQREFDAQNSPSGFVDDALRNFSGAYLRRDCGAKEIAFHVHVHARLKGLARHGWPVADGVVLQLTDSAPIRNHKAVKAPLSAQDLGEDERVGGGRNAVDGIERTHDGSHSRLYRSVVRREVDLAQRLLAHVGCVVIAPCDGGAVRGEVLDACRDRIELRKIALLIALDPSTRHHGAKVWIFAVGLHDAAPARIAGDIDHGREDPIDTVGARFDRA